MRRNGCGEMMKKEYTIEERASLLDGLDVWQTKPLSDLPSILMTDGPHGLRKQRSMVDNLGSEGSEVSVCYPTASLMACSFDPKLIEKMALSLANEALSKGVHIILGPGVNIKRSPLCGRSFEYFSEDPVLSGTLASAYIRALQAKNIGCSLKHFCCNNQETNRFHQDSIVEERALHEIYLKAFRLCMKENPATIMASYNRVNGYYATEHPVLSQILREKWGYNGLLVSDWGAISNRIAAVKYGLDLEMPSSNGYNMKKLIQEAKVSDAIRQAINASSKRVIQTVERYQNNPIVKTSLDEAHKVAHEVAAESMVLLKNDHILPFKADEKVLYIGAFMKKFRYQGGGSSYINSYRVLELADLLPTYAKDPHIVEGYTLTGDGTDETLYQEALEQAGLYDKIVLVTGLPEQMETEGVDRKDINLPLGQEKLLSALLEVNPNLVTVVLSGSVVSLACASKGKGLLLAYLSGEAGAAAILDILYGKVNPSGRLPETWINNLADCNVKIGSQDRVYYDESIYVGYRYYQTFNRPVAYPFGYGLSYTTFAYQNLKVSNRILTDELEVTCEVKNTGAISGKVVVQLYVENNSSSVYKPKRELRQFQKIKLEPGEAQVVTFHLTTEDFSYYDNRVHDFICNAGEYKIQICEDANHVLLEELIARVEEDPRFKDHPRTSYHKEQYDTSDFPVIFGAQLPKIMMHRRPFTMDSTLKQLRASLLGAIIGSVIIRMAKQKASATDVEWMKKTIKMTMLETPIRSIAVMSSGQLSLLTAQGIVEVCNWHLIKGLKNIFKGMKHDE